MAKKSNPNARKTVEVDRKRIPFWTLFNGKELRDGIAALEKFRQSFNEQEILYGCKIHVQGSYDEYYAVVTRLETDKEYNDRLEKQRIAREKREAAEAKRAANRIEREKKQAEERRQHALECIKELAKEQGLTVQEVIDNLAK